jgi:pilus assembly protein Flp/PilA
MEMWELRKVRPALAATAVRFLRDTRAATAIEYGIIAAGVGAAVAATVWSLGTSLKATFYDKLANLFS